MNHIKTVPSHETLLCEVAFQIIIFFKETFQAVNNFNDGRSFRMTTFYQLDLAVRYEKK